MTLRLIAALSTNSPALVEANSRGQAGQHGPPSPARTRSGERAGLHGRIHHNRLDCSAWFVQALRYSPPAAGAAANLAELLSLVCSGAALLLQTASGNVVGGGGGSEPRQGGRTRERQPGQRGGIGRLIRRAGWGAAHEGFRSVLIGTSRSGTADQRSVPPQAIAVSSGSRCGKGCRAAWG